MELKSSGQGSHTPNKEVRGAGLSKHITLSRKSEADLEVRKWPLPGQKVRLTAKSSSYPAATATGQEPASAGKAETQGHCDAQPPNYVFARPVIPTLKNLTLVSVSDRADNLNAPSRIPTPHSSPFLIWCINASLPMLPLL